MEGMNIWAESPGARDALLEEFGRIAAITDESERLRRLQNIAARVLVQRFFIGLDFGDQPSITFTVGPFDVVAERMSVSIPAGTQAIIARTGDHDPQVPRD